MKRAFLLIVAIALLVSPAFAAEKTIQIKYTQVLTPDFAGWGLYKSATAGGPYEFITNIPYTTQQNEYSVTQKVVVADGSVSTIYFVMDSYDKSGNRSTKKSNEKSVTIDFEAPGEPFIVTIIVTE